MFKKPNILAIVSFLLIPAATMLGAMLANAIDPEFALRGSNYERDFWLLEQVRNLVLLATLAVNVGLWCLTCFFLLKSKGQSIWWLPLAVLGPFGLIVLALLGDKGPAPGDLYRQFILRLHGYLRVAYELCLFVAVWVIAFQAMVLKRELMIAYESAVIGTSRAEIIERQNASSGMWAFSEGLEILYLVVLVYLLWPICFNLLGGVIKSRAASRSP